VEADGRAVSNADIILLFGEKGSLKVGENGYMLNPSANSGQTEHPQMLIPAS